MNNQVKVFIGSDHAGFKVKEKIKEYLNKKGFSYEDLSPDYIANDDYPDYAFKVAQKVTKNKDSRGVLICGTGTGMVIAANKVKGARAAVIYDNYSAQMSRKDNNVNIACLRGRKLFPNKDIRFLEIWLNTDFSHINRHIRRLSKISSYESK